MIKVIVTLVHILQLAIHSWFMYETLLAFAVDNVKDNIWNQVKYLTNFSNWMMFSFLIPFIYFDIKNYNQKKIKNRYPTLINLLFQGLHPVIFLVMASYQTFMYIDPKLLLMNGFNPDPWQMVLLFYLHSGNWILLQVEYFLYEHEIIPKQKLFIFFFSYTAVYFSIYGAYFYFEGKHVYGFQQSLGVGIVIVLNFVQFIIMFSIDFVYQKITHSVKFKQFILESRFTNSTEKTKSKSK